MNKTLYPCMCVGLDVNTECPKCCSKMATVKITPAMRQKIEENFIMIQEALEVGLDVLCEEEESNGDV